MVRRIACIGGGPGGLYFALLAKLADPSREVSVYERNHAADTFGFGVAFSDANLAQIAEVDPLLRATVHDHGVHWDPVEIRLKGQRLFCGGMGMSAVSRKTLLGHLQARALVAGVDIRFENDVDPRDLMASDPDLVVASDGANSLVRTMYADQFSPTIEVARAKYIWFATTHHFHGLTFLHERGPHGVFAVHGYPIGNGTSTFIVETDEACWRAAGLDTFDVNQQAGASDEESRRYLEKLFAEQIDGSALLGNSSRWSNFRTLRTRAWSHDRVALLGDAAHTAHFSVGSGTKQAIDDAVALAGALDRHPDDVSALLVEYEDARQPPVATRQDAARSSLSWWERFGRYHDAFEPWQFAYHFLTRTLTDGQLARHDDDFVQDTHDRWRMTHRSAPLHTPMSIAGATHGGRYVVVHGWGDRAWACLDSGRLDLRTASPRDGSAWGLWLDAPDDEAALPAAMSRLASEIAEGPDLVAVAGGSPLARQLLTEQARLGHATVSVLMADEPELQAPGPAAERSFAALVDWAQTMVLSGRTDMVGMTEQLAQTRR